MSVAARLRKLEAGVATVDRVDYTEGKPKMTVRYEGNATPEQRAATAAFIARAIALWPLLADLAEAAETYQAAVEGGREDGGIALQVTYRSLVAALARVAEQIDEAAKGDRE